MIVIFAGDSYTEGVELWEEKNISGYALMTSDEARLVVTYHQANEDERRDLTYTGFIKKLRPNWEIHNVGKGGASQQMIAENLFNHYVKLKWQNPTEKIVCVMQDTFRHRMTFYSSQKYQVEGLNVDKIDNHKYFYPETTDLVDYVKKFVDEETLATQFYSQSFMIRDFFEKLNVPFFNFSFYNHEYTYRGNESQKFVSMKREYLETNEIFEMGALQRVYDYYDINERRAVLPNWHLKSRYHEIVAEDLVKHIEGKL
jgi:hypothetical protein